MIDFSNLNDKQIEAVSCTEGPLLILAGAGSGKTTVLINRIANIVSQGLALPWQIMAITFTNKAAGELKDRLEKMLGEPGKDVKASTFHSACLKIIRTDGSNIGYPSNVTIYDTDDSQKVIKNILKDMEIPEKMLPPKMVLSYISKYKDDGLIPDDALLEAQKTNDPRRLRIAQIFKRYTEKLKSSNALDFDDIIVETLHLFNECPDILKKYQNRLKYIMVDEYQDTDRAQFRLIKMLSGGYNNICVVGDDDQSIYAFRGATIENILNFESNFSDAKVIRLEQNYRSTQNILSAANEVISNNQGRKGKNLWTNSGDGEKLKLFIVEDEREEARKIASMILKSHEQGIPYADNAVLYRINAQSQTLESEFVKYSIPYKIVGGQRFFDRKEIKDIIAYLCVIANPNDELRMERIINEPKRGIGDATLGTISEISNLLGITRFEVMQNAENYAPLSKKALAINQFANLISSYQDLSESLSVSELIDEVVSTSGYADVLKAEGITGETRIENIEELKTMAEHFSDESEDKSLFGFLQDVALYTDLDDYEESDDKVTLMTIHSAKGLEFTNVFIPGMEDGLFPSNRSLAEQKEIEEERRLCYVAITRAKKDLTMIATKRRMIFGKTSYFPLSRFVKEIPEELVDFTAPQQKYESKIGINFDEESREIKRDISSFIQKSKQSNTDKYNVGDSVIHNVFGRGTILDIKPMGGDYLLEIEFSTGRKKIMANFAKLERG